MVLEIILWKGNFHTRKVVPMKYQSSNLRKHTVFKISTDLDCTFFASSLKLQNSNTVCFPIKIRYDISQAFFALQNKNSKLSA